MKKINFFLDPTQPNPLQNEKFGPKPNPTQPMGWPNPCPSLCRIMYRTKQFCAWRATSETDFHHSQTGADRGVVLPLHGCPDVFRSRPVSWKRPQLCPGSGRVEKVRWRRRQLAFGWQTTPKMGVIRVTRHIFNFDARNHPERLKRELPNFAHR